ncbi:Bro-N domain-containing protein [Candidatus Dojkabacteria bacterium]|jgi:hypothetical protein|nr:Bro-N domain-containing protein [Candidatus Dojkabacteria bacterium]
MNKEKSVAIFNKKQVRRHWDEEKEEWYFSIVDVISVLTESKDSAVYWRVLKKRLMDEGSNETVTKCNGLKMLAADGKMRTTDCFATQDLLRIIQSIPSPKAEPFKLWLAKVGNERIDETADPEKAFERAMRTYLAKGYSREWINQRLKSIEIRKDLTDEWEERGIKEGMEFAILTDDITKGWSGLSVKEYKNLKGLKKEGLRDNMTNMELVLNMLSETVTTEISKKEKPKTFQKNRDVAKRGGKIGGKARKNIEIELGKSVVSKSTYLHKEKKKKLLNK